MSSPAQITANRANAQLSTGPATPSGKARSSRNAAGPIAQFLTATEADQEDLQSLIDGYTASVRPLNFLEYDILVEMATAQLRRLKLLQFESSLLASTTSKVEAELGPGATRVQIQALVLERLIDGSKIWATLHRYLRDAERTYYRCMKALLLETPLQPAAPEKPTPEPRKNEANLQPVPAQQPQNKPPQPVHRYAKDVPLRPNGYPVNLALAL